MPCAGPSTDVSASLKMMGVALLYMLYIYDGAYSELGKCHGNLRSSLVLKLGERERKKCKLQSRINVQHSFSTVIMNSAHC